MIQLFSTVCMLIGFLILGWALRQMLAERRQHEDFLKRIKRLNDAQPLARLGATGRWCEFCPSKGKCCVCNNLH